MIQSARRVIRSDSGSSTQSGTSQDSETDLTPISSPVLDWASASSPLSDPAPSCSSARSSGVLDSLRKKRIKLIINQSDTESDNETDISNNEPVNLVVTENLLQ